jgi:hypothetical protein
MRPAVTARVVDTHVGVGDPFVYVVEGRGEGARVFADTGAFTVLATKTTRSGDTVRVEQTIACLDRGCAPGATMRRVFLPPARVVNADGTASGRAPAIVVVPRVPAKAVAASRAPYRTQLDVPKPNAPAGAIGVLLLVAAAVLLAAAVAVMLRRPKRAASAAAGRSRADALRLLRESARRPVPDRRRAADFAGRFALHDEANRVAWGPPDPEAGDVQALADRIESSAR